MPDLYVQALEKFVTRLIDKKKSDEKIILLNVDNLTTAVKQAVVDTSAFNFGSCYVTENPTEYVFQLSGGTIGAEKWSAQSVHHPKSNVGWYVLYVYSGRVRTTSIENYSQGYVIGIYYVPANAQGHRVGFDENSTQLQYVYGYAAVGVVGTLLVISQMAGKLIRSIDGAKIEGDLVVDGTVTIQNLEDSVRLTADALQILEDENLLALFNKTGIYFFDTAGNVLSKFDRTGVYFYDSSGNVLSSYRSDGADIAGWQISTNLLKSANEGIRLNATDNRVEIWNNGSLKLAFGYLGGIGSHDSTEFGIWVGAPDALYIEANGTDEVVQQVSGDWVVQNDADIKIKDGSGNEVLRIGTDSSERGLFVWDTSGNLLAKYTSSGVYLNGGSITVDGGWSTTQIADGAVTISKLASTPTLKLPEGVIAYWTMYPVDDISGIKPEGLTDVSLLHTFYKNIGGITHTLATHIDGGVITTGKIQGSTQTTVIDLDNDYIDVANGAVRIGKGVLSSGGDGIQINNGNLEVVGGITADHIAAEAITTEKLATGAVTAEKLNVSELSAITANAGTITAGKLQGASSTTVVDLDNDYIDVASGTVRIGKGVLSDSSDGIKIVDGKIEIEDSGGTTTLRGDLRTFQVLASFYTTVEANSSASISTGLTDGTRAPVFLAYQYDDSQPGAQAVSVCVNDPDITIFLLYKDDWGEWRIQIVNREDHTVELYIYIFTVYLS